MTVSRWRERISGWRLNAKRRRRLLEQRLRLERWFPHVLIALTMAPLGLLLVTAGAETLLGGGFMSSQITDLEHRATVIHNRPIIDLILGLSVIAISIGVALRSRLAWLWSLALMGLGLALRLPPEQDDVPVASYFALILLMLFASRRTFANRSVITSALFAIVMLLTFIAWSTVGIFHLGTQFRPPIHDLTTAFYVTVVTASSVGYGDFVPQTSDARMFVMAIISLGLLVGATAISSILMPLIGGRMRQILGGSAHVNRTSHYIIVGMSPLARNAATELEKRKQRVTLILEKAPDEEFYRQRDVIIGDAADLSVLQTAGTGDSKGVLALSTDDATNGFVVLGVNEIDATIPTVAALNEPSNENRLQRTQPSLLLSLQALGGQLLAMALTGERVDVEMLTRVLKIHGADAADDKAVKP